MVVDGWWCSDGGAMVVVVVAVVTILRLVWSRQRFIPEQSKHSYSLSVFTRGPRYFIVGRIRQDYLGREPNEKIWRNKYAKTVVLWRRLAIGAFLFAMSDVNRISY